MSTFSPQWEHVVSSTWTYDPVRRVVETANGDIVADLSSNGLSAQPVEWNGLLIAAAPNLFGALDSILHLLETHASGVYYRDAEVTYADDTFKKALGEADDE